MQRRLVFSPEAIHQSPCRRRERLAGRLRALEALRRDGQAVARIGLSRDIELDADEFEDLEDEPSCEQEQPAEEILDPSDGRPLDRGAEDRDRDATASGADRALGAQRQGRRVDTITVTRNEMLTR